MAFGPCFITLSAVPPQHTDSLVLCALAFNPAAVCSVSPCIRSSNARRSHQPEAAAADAPCWAAGNAAVHQALVSCAAGGGDVEARVHAGRADGLPQHGPGQEPPAPRGHRCKCECACGSCSYVPHTIISTVACDAKTAVDICACARLGANRLHCVAAVLGVAVTVTVAVLVDTGSAHSLFTHPVYLEQYN